MADNQNAQDPFVTLTSDSARQYLLLDIARRFKGTDPEVDAKIDAHAELISGRQGIKFIPPVVKGEPRVPFYMEGEPGVGKTTLIRAAIQEFCKLTGLNFIENPEDGHRFSPKDFYYVTVNLSGKTNPMDIGGLPSKGELETSAGVEARRRASDAGAWLMAELESKTKSLAGFVKLGVTEPVTFDKGALKATEVTLKGDAAQVDAVLSTVIRQLGEEVKKHGAGLALLKDGEEPADGRLSLQLKKGATGARLTAYAPMTLDAESEYVAEMLPNRRFAMATKTKFALFNFDDVANASESVRNVLLEVAQSNRYSGVMDIGNAMVTFTGNMGAEDNTNTQSEQSDAEVTRVFKVRVRDTPRDWARRVATKYNEVGDCMFSAFIHRHGNNDGIFRDAIGEARSARGLPKPNSRSLENALAKVLPFFQMAQASKVSPTIFSDEIHLVVKGTVGPVVADSYTAFMRAMLTEAIPLADELLKSGKLNMEKFEKHMGNGAKASEQDFGFRFAAAVADAFVHKIAFDDGARAASADKDKMRELISESTEFMCRGLAQLDPGTMNYALSRAMARMGSVARLGADDGVQVTLNPATHDAMALGFAKTLRANIWPDAEKAEKDFLKVVAGSNIAGAPKATKKPKP